MILDFKTTREITKGVMEVREEDGAFCFLRFTEKQQSIYEPGTKHHRHSQNGAGVCLDFTTDSENFSFDYVNSEAASNGSAFFFELYEDGAFRFRKGFSFEKTEEAAIPRRAPDGKLSFALAKGRKRVTLYFPRSFLVRLKNVTLDDGAELVPYRPRLKFLAFGDSITEGISAQFNSMAYVNLLARYLDAEALNFGIGGEVFRPDKIVAGTYPKCDFVTVAYGTNDYRKVTRESFLTDMPGFFRNLAREFGDTRVFVLLPLWRQLEEDGVVFENGTLEEVRGLIAAEASRYPNVTVINCRGFVPHLPDFFADQILHPNSLGFSLYASALEREIRPLL